MEARSRTIALFGLFGVGNIGNEASLSSAIRAITSRSADTSVVVVCTVPDVVSQEHGVEAVPLWMSGPVPTFGRFPAPIRVVLRPVVEIARWVASYRFLRSVEAVVVPGTGIMDDFGMSPWQMPWDLWRWSMVARLARRPFLMLSVGAGPIEHPFSRRLAVRTVRNAAVCTFRDEGSRAFMAGLGAPVGTDSVRPDLVFALERPDDARVSTTGDGPARRTIAIGLMAYYGWSNSPDTGADIFRTYIAAMVDVTTRVLAMDYDVRVLVGEDTDEHAVRELLAAIGEHAPQRTGRLVVEPIRSVPDLLRQISLTDAVVATRFHNIVGALMMCRPTVSIGYAEKNRELMESAGLAQYCHRVEHIEPDRIIADLTAQLSDAERIERDLGEWNAAQTSAVERLYETVFATNSTDVPQHPRSDGASQ